MTVARELVIASVVLLGSGGLMAIAFTEPGPTTPTTVAAGTGPSAPEPEMAAPVAPGDDGLDLAALEADPATSEPFADDPLARADGFAGDPLAEPTGFAADPLAGDPLGGDPLAGGVSQPPGSRESDPLMAADPLAGDPLAGDIAPPAGPGDGGAVSLPEVGPRQADPPGWGGEIETFPELDVGAIDESEPEVGLDIPVAEPEVAPVEVREAPTPVAAAPGGGARTAGPAGPVIDAIRSGRPIKDRYVVQPGDSYQVISEKMYGTTRHWRFLEQTNGIGQYDLQPGQELRIPQAPASAAPSAVAPAAVAPAAGGQTHKVQKGESYYTIARDRLGDASRYRELEQLNGIPGVDLRPGQVIRLGEVSASRAAMSGDSGRPVPVPAGATVHVVVRGDLLSDLSVRYYGTARRWRAIAEANGITDDRSLKVGQRLVIPGASGPAPRANPASDGTRHTVAKGETLQIISRKHFGTTRRWRAIAAANGIQDDRALRAGQVLVIPGVTEGGQEAPRPAAQAPRRQSVAPAPAPAPEPEPEPPAPVLPALDELPGWLD